MVAVVAEQNRGSGHGLEYGGGALVIAHLAFGEQHDARTAAVVADRVEF